MNTESTASTKLEYVLDDSPGVAACNEELVRHKMSPTKAKHDPTHADEVARGRRASTLVRAQHLSRAVCLESEEKSSTVEAEILDGDEGARSTSRSDAGLGEIQRPDGRAVEPDGG